MTQPASEPKYPEHERLKARQEEHHFISEFLEWCENNEITLTEMESIDIGRVPIIVYPADVIARYFEIDQRKFEAEKLLMLKAYLDG